MSTHSIVNEGFLRPEPPLTPRTKEFWTSGHDGALRIAQCDDCGQWMHPPQPVCRSCQSRSISSTAVAGTGTVFSYTVNRYQWSPTIEPPYVIAEVALDDADVVLMTALIDCEIHAVSIGMPVDVCFAISGDTFIPLFRPVTP